MGECGGILAPTESRFAGPTATVRGSGVCGPVPNPENHLPGR